MNQRATWLSRSLSRIISFTNFYPDGPNTCIGLTNIVVRMEVVKEGAEK